MLRLFVDICLLPFKLMWWAFKVVCWTFLIVLGYESKETGSKEKIRLPQTEWRVVKGKHKAIIKKEVFDEVQEMINAKKKMVPESAANFG